MAQYAEHNAVFYIKQCYCIHRRFIILIYHLDLIILSLENQRRANYQP